MKKTSHHTLGTKRGAKARLPITQTVSAKYIFLDVVGFTHHRSVEAQSEIVGVLNSIVRTALSRIDKKDVILLPTGDGICICLLNIDSPYDVHVRVSLDIVERIFRHNKHASPMRRFEARVGINANIDNLVVDVNGKRNIAGAGINLAQRVMSTADGGQVIVGQPVFETLSQREKYLNAFRSYAAKIKHGAQLPVHQLVESGHLGLNTDIPTQFQHVVVPEAELTKLAAYYIDHAIRNREFLKSNIRHGQEAYAATLLLYFHAMDSVDKSEASDLDPPSKPKVWGDAEATMDEKLEYYCKIHFWLCAETNTLIIANSLQAYDQCFEHGSSGFEWHFVSKKGKEKLAKEWPQIWSEFGLDVALAT